MAVLKKKAMARDLPAEALRAKYSMLLLRWARMSHKKDSIPSKVFNHYFELMDNSTAPGGKMIKAKIPPLWDVFELNSAIELIEEHINLGNPIRIINGPSSRSSNSGKKRAKPVLKERMLELLEKKLSDYQDINLYHLRRALQDNFSRHNIPSEEIIKTWIMEIIYPGRLDLEPTPEKRNLWAFIKSRWNSGEPLPSSEVKNGDNGEEMLKLAEKIYSNDPRKEELGMNEWQLAIRDVFGAWWDDQGIKKY